MISLLLYGILPYHQDSRVCLFAVVGGMLCKSDKPSIIIIIYQDSKEFVSQTAMLINLQATQLTP